MDVVQRDLRIMSIPEVRKVLPVSRTSVYNLIDQGELHRVKIGDRTFITVESLQRYLGKIFALGDEDPELRAGAEQAVREAGGMAK
jgi:excisionase family DNA binding protein